jgi:hypothetical protein
MSTRAFCLALLMFGCAPAPELEEGSGPTEIVDDDGKFDSASELYARVTGMSVWVDKTAQVATRDGRSVWLLEGRASRDLDGVFSFVPDDPFCRAQVLSARRFEVFCEPGSELNSVLSGLPLFVSLTPKSGPGAVSATAAVWFAPRFARFSGSSKVSVDAKVSPVYLAGGSVSYRGRAQTQSPYHQLVVAADDDFESVVYGEGTRKFRFDWPYPALEKALGDRVRFTAHSSSGSVSKYAGFDVAVPRLGLTTGDPYQVYAEECLASVKACLKASSPTQPDYESCGTYRQVQRCGGRPLAIMPEPATIAADLKKHLVGWYQQHGVPAGANTLAQAQAAVDVNLINRIGLAEEDPLGHDLEKFFVFMHPDVVFPGSDRRWFVVYDRVWGKLADAYDFN